MTETVIKLVAIFTLLTLLWDYHKYVATFNRPAIYDYLEQEFARRDREFYGKAAVVDCLLLMAVSVLLWLAQ